MKTIMLLSCLAAFWCLMGCASSEEVENYKVLDEDHDSTELDTEPYGDAGSTVESTELGASSYERRATDPPDPDAAERLVETVVSDAAATVQMSQESPTPPVDDEFSLITESSDHEAAALAGAAIAEEEALADQGLADSDVETIVEVDESVAETPIVVDVADFDLTEFSVEVPVEPVPVEEDIEVLEVPQAPAPPMDPGAPSVTGQDRSAWPKVKVGPADGTTYHEPLYFSECPISHKYATVVDGDSAPASLDGWRPAHYDATNTLNLLVQPMKIGADMVLSPWYLIQQHPWSEVTSP